MWELRSHLNSSASHREFGIGFGGRSGIGIARGRNSLFITCTLICASRCAPSSDQRICLCFAIRLLTT
jgi:hypothetical protein